MIFYITIIFHTTCFGFSALLLCGQKIKKVTTIIKLMNNLHQIVNHLSCTYLPSAVCKHSFFVNDVPADLAIDHNREWIASVIEELLATVTGHANKTCIRLSAKKQGHFIVFTIQELGNSNSYAMAVELKQAFSLAEQIGGCLSISVPVIDHTTISFSFPNQPVLAA